MSTIRAKVPLFCALVVFLVFFTNVLLGSAGLTSFLSDVGEAVTLFVAVLFFAIGILLAEAEQKGASQAENQ